MAANLAALIEDSIAGGATTLGMLSGTGAGMYVPQSVRRRVIKLAVATAAGRARILVGASDISTAQVAANIQDAATYGADAVLVQPVMYQPLRSEEIVGLYRDIASVSPLPIWADNNPAETHYRLSSDELVTIATMKGVRGLKDSAGTASESRDRQHRIFDRLAPRTAQRVEFGVSSLSYGGQSLLDGAATWHSVLAGVLPDYFGVIVNAVADGRRAEVRQLQRPLSSLGILVEKFGSLRVAHAIMSLRGEDPGALPRPLLPLPRDVRTLLRVTLDALVLDPSARDANRAAVAKRLTGTPRDSADKPSGQPRRATT